MTWSALEAEQAAFEDEHFSVEFTCETCEVVRTAWEYEGEPVDLTCPVCGIEGEQL